MSDEQPLPTGLQLTALDPVSRYAPAPRPRRSGRRNDEAGGDADPRR